MNPKKISIRQNTREIYPKLIPEPFMICVRDALSQWLWFLALFVSIIDLMGNKHNLLSQSDISRSSWAITHTFLPFSFN